MGRPISIQVIPQIKFVSIWTIPQINPAETDPLHIFFSFKVIFFFLKKNISYMFLWGQKLKSVHWALSPIC